MIRNVKWIREGRSRVSFQPPFWLLLLIPPAFLSVFLFYPLVSLLALSFAPGGRIDLSGIRELASDPYYARVLGFTIAQAVASTVLTLLAALPTAYAFARYQFPAQNFLRALATIPFLMPTVVIAVAFNAMFGPRGWLNLALMNAFSLEAPPVQLLNTIWIILIAHVFYNFTIVLRLVGGFWSNLDPQFVDAAYLLGANRVRAFFEITLPLLAPAILGAALLIFIFDFTSFGVVLLLGGARLATLEVEIYRQTVNLFNLPLAASLSVLQILCTSALTLIYSSLQAAHPLRFRPQTINKRRAQTGREKLLLGVIIGAMIIFLGAPLMTLFVESFRGPDGFAFANYTNLLENPRGSVTFVPPIDAVRNSLMFALAVVALAAILGLSAAYTLQSRRAPESTPSTLRKRLSGIAHPLIDAIYMLPLGTSAVTLGFGYLIALDKPPFNLRATIWLVPLAHGLIAFPFVLRSILPILRGMKPQLRQAASVLGANPARVWREIDLPIIARALGVGAVFAFVISLGEFGATSLIVLPEFPTIPIAIYRLLGQPGISNLGQAIALSVILMTVSSLAIFGMEKLRVGQLGEF